MTKNELNQGFEAIAASEGKKEAVWKNIEAEIEERGVSFEKRKQRGFKKALGTLAATAAIFAILIIPTTIFADEIKDFFVGILSQDKQMEEIVKTNVFEATDMRMHAKIEVKELVSDGHSAMATIVYTALDDEGRKWLSRDVNYLDSTLSLSPGKIGKNNIGETVLMLSASCSYGCREAEELRTDDSRTYIAVLSSNGDPVTETLVLSYPMPSKMSNFAEINRTSTENHMYTMVKAEENAEENEDSKARQPVIFKISKLSWGIFGYNNGVYEHYGNTYRLTRPDDDYTPSVEIYFSDGKSMTLYPDFFDGAMNSVVNGKTLDLNICGGDFINYKLLGYGSPYEDRDYNGYLMDIDPAQVVSVKLNGIMYNLQ